MLKICLCKYLNTFRQRAKKTHSKYELVITIFAFAFREIKNLTLASDRV